MIRTVVVEDDFRVAELHRAYTERLQGFCVVGTASTGAQAIELVARARPDLVLLDVHLPDMSGIDVIHALRAPGATPVDIVAITAARDVDTLRGAMRGGVLHYLVKPFRFAAFEERMRAYVAARTRLARLSEADQHEVDRVFQTLRTGVEQRPKGLSEATLDVVLRVLGTSTRPVSAEELASRSGLSRVTARRYLEHLAQSGQVELRLRYGGPGRPEHRYQLLTSSTRETPA